MMKLADHELVVDNFAGGGGASVGLEDGLGRSVDIAINHDADAVCMHQANHPNARHYHEDILDVSPTEAAGGQRVGLAWFSPDCKHFSRAKGGQPNRSDKVRGLAWVVTRWAEEVRPRIIMLENVEEFEDWGPLDECGRPIKERMGETFREWNRRLHVLGYKVQWRSLVAADYGAPTTRRRLFLIARRDGLPIVWPKESHAKEEHVPAHTIVDWSLECPSVFGARPSGRKLVKATMNRVVEGLRRFVFEAEYPTPFIIRTGHAWKDGTVPGGWRGQQITDPLATVCSTNDKNLVVPWVARHWGGMVGRDINMPWPTITQKGAQDQLCAAFLMKYFGTGGARPITEPIGALTTKARYGLVEVHGSQYQLMDVGMRMLQPHELYAAQAFPDDYIIDPVLDGRRLTKTAQIKLCGNSVCPPIPKAMVQANCNPGGI